MCEIYNITIAMFVTVFHPQYTGHTQKNGAVSIELEIETAPFFCVCTV
jgi:hypothetical protein